MTGWKHHTHTQHTTPTTKTRWAAASLPPVMALSYISMATSAMAPNHGATAPHKSLAGAWRWVCSCCGWFPWLGCQIKIHQKIESVIGHGIGGKVSQLKWCDSLKASRWSKRRRPVITQSHCHSTSDGSEIQVHWRHVLYGILYIGYPLPHRLKYLMSY